MCPKIAKPTDGSCANLVAKRHLIMWDCWASKGSGKPNLEVLFPLDIIACATQDEYAIVDVLAEVVAVMHPARREDTQKCFNFKR